MVTVTTINYADEIEPNIKASRGKTDLLEDMEIIQKTRTA
jgi:hypothetical protein